MSPRISVLRIVCIALLLISCISISSVTAAQEGVVHFPLSGITVSPGDPDLISDGKDDENPIIKIIGFDFSKPSFVSLVLDIFNIHDVPVWIAEAIALLLTLFFSGSVFFFLYTHRKLSEDPASRPMILLSYLREQPGMRQIDLIKVTGFSRGSVSYNLKRLLAEQRIRKSKGGVVRYYPAGTPSPLQDDPAWKLLENHSRQMIFGIILEYPGISQKQISRITGIPITTLRWHLARLQRLQVITFEKNLNITCYTVSSSFVEKYRSLLKIV